MSPNRKPLAKAHALFYKGLKEVDGNESKIKIVYGRTKISFFVRNAVAAKYTSEGEGLAGSSGSGNTVGSDASTAVGKRPSGT